VARLIHVAQVRPRSSRASIQTTTAVVVRRMMFMLCQAEQLLLTMHSNYIDNNFTEFWRSQLN